MSDNQFVDWLEKNIGNVELYCRKNTVIIQLLNETWEGESLREAMKGIKDEPNN